MADRQTIQGYRLGEILGRNVEGGRLTYAGVRVEDDLDVVIKQFSFARQDADWAGFKSHQRELQILEKLDHPSIPRFLDAFQVEDGFWLVQQFVDAPDLHKKRRWAYEEVEDIARQMLEILAYLQNNQPPITHRDIKPANILRDEDGQLYLIDFGLARDAQRGSGGSTISAGTPGFMAPEQFFNTGVDDRTDLYGLGATLFALLAGIATEEMRHHVNTAFIFDFDALPDDTPEAFTAWLTRMTHPEKSERFDDAVAALDALDALDKNERALVARELEPTPLTRTRAVTGEPTTRKPTSKNPMLEQWTGKDEPDGFGWKGKVIGGVVATLILTTAIAIPTGMRASSENIPNALRAPVMFIKSLDYPDEGEDYRCMRGAVIEMTAGEYGAPQKIGDVFMNNGCTLILRHVDAGSIVTDEPSTRLELINVDAKNVTIQAGTASLFGGSAEQLVTSKGGDATIEESELQHLVVGKGSRVEVTNVQVTSRFSVGEGGILTGKDLRSMGYGNLGHNAKVKLDGVRVAKHLTLAPSSIIVMRAPVFGRALPQDHQGHVLIVKDGEDIDAAFESFVETSSRAILDSERKAKAREERKQTIEQVRERACALVSECFKGRSGAHTIEILYTDGVPAAKGDTLACAKEQITALSKASDLSGTLTCTYNVEQDNGVLLLETKSLFRE